MRGEPTRQQVVDRLLAVWPDDMEFTRYLSNVLAAGGYKVEQYKDVLFCGTSDSELLRCVKAYEDILERWGP